MTHGFFLLVSLTALLTARSGFCRSITEEKSYNNTFLPQPKAAVTADPCSSNPRTITLNIGDYAALSTPNYPSNYPRFHKCSWKFQAGTKAKLSLNCPIVQLNWLATLYVNDGSKTIRKACWICFPTTFTHDFTSTSTEIGLDNSFFFQGSGFTCQITASEDPEATTASPPPPPSDDCNCGVPVRTSRIVGGVETEEHEYPWMAQLQSKFGISPFCGGSIINNKFILTAAHCTRGSLASAVRVRLGVHRASSPYTGSALSRDAKRFIEHDSYGSPANSHDIALIEVETIDFTTVGPTIRPICIPDGNSNYEGDTATVAGWGHTTQGGSGASYLREVNVPVISNSLCSTYYGSSRITSDMICAGIVGKDSCQGDSGGPIFKTSSSGNYVDQIGIVSWGNGCALDKYPGVYARVTELRSWIIRNTAGSVACATPA